MNPDISGRKLYEIAHHVLVRQRQTEGRGMYIAQNGPDLTHAVHRAGILISFTLSHEKKGEI
jgi:predicted RNA-binding protein YlxR (DUF448 family)